MCKQTAQAYPMTNSHILANSFEYLEPATLQEAVALLAQYGDEAQLLAGGTYLLVQAKQERKTPRYVINIAKLHGLKGAAHHDRVLALGALTTIRDTRDLGPVRTQFQALAEACAAFGSMQIQIMGTLGGNLCNGSPASDTVPALLAFDAELELVGPGGTRTVPLADFLLGPGQTALERGEVLTRVLLPEPEPNTGSAFVKISRVKADLAKLSAAAVITQDGDRVADCRLAFGAAAPTVIRAYRAEAFLKGRVFSPEVALEAGAMAMEEVGPIDDVRSTAWYRRQVVTAVTHDVLVAAWDRAVRYIPLGGVQRSPVSGSTDGHASLRVGPNEKHPVELVVNGEKRRVWAAPNALLLNALREDLGLTGPKYGCGIGECGACTILLDGRPTLACLTLALAANGAEVTTVEGLQAPDGTLHPLQEAFLDYQAFQCGYCTPGMLIMSKALLEDIAMPTEDDVREYLRGNRCRCTGFASIVRAVVSCVNRQEA